jgi:outer membrane protein
MNHRLILLFLIHMTVFPTLLPAAEDPSLSLSDAIYLAQSQNPKIKAAQSQITAADHRITQAKSGYLPQINFIETYGHTTTPMWAFGTRLNQKTITSADFAPDRLNHPDAIDNFNSVLSLEWPVFRGGQTQIGVNQAKLDKSAQSLILERTRQEVIAQTAMAYTGLQLAFRHLEVIQKALETAKAHYEMIRSRYENGLVVKSDLLRTQVHIAELDQERIQAESRIAMARSALNAAMGLSGENNQVLTSLLEKGEDIQEPIEEWIHQAQFHRPDMKYLQLQQEIAEAEINKTKAAHLPTVNLIGTYEINSSNFQDSADNYTIGAMMRVNLFSGNQLSAKTSEADALLSRIKAIKSDMSSGIEVQTREAYLQAQSAWNRISVAETAVSQSEEGLRIVKDRYENGLLTLISLLDAEVALQSAQTNRYKSLYEYNASRIQLSLAAGILDTDFK